MANFGADGWAAVAVGQAIGSVAAVVIELGWGLIGPQRASSLDRPHLQKLWADVVSSKFLAFLVLVPLIGIVAVLVGSIPSVVLWVAIGSASFGLTPAWILYGLGDAKGVLWAEGLPKAFAVAAATGILLCGGGLFWVGATQLAAGIAAPVIASSRLQFSLISHDWRFIWQETAWRAVGLRVTSSVYMAMPTIILAAVSPAVVAAFSGVERLVRIALAVLQIVPQSQQPLMGRATDVTVRSLGLRLTATNAALGLVAGLVFALVLPFIVDWMFLGELELSPVMSLSAAILILTTCISRATGSLWLVRRNSVGWIWCSAVVGAITCPMFLILGSRIGGAAGAMLALVLVEVAVLIVQSVGLFRVETQVRGSLRED